MKTSNELFVIQLFFYGGQVSKETVVLRQWERIIV